MGHGLPLGHIDHETRPSMDPRHCDPQTARPAATPDAHAHWKL